MALTQVSTAGVKDDAVTAGKIPANAVGSSELADNAVDTAAIANDSITNAKLASDSVGTSKIIDGAVGTNELAADAVTTSKINNNAVTTDKIADGTIVNADINASAAISKSKIETFVNTNGDNRVLTGTGTANTIQGEPQLLFDSNGLLYIKAPDGGNRYFFGETGNSQSAQLSLYNSSDTQKVRIAAGDGGSAADTYFNGGNVGIGTSSPSTTLSVINDDADQGFNVKHSNLTKGVNIGYEKIQTVGTANDITLDIQAKGSGANLRCGTNGQHVFGALADSRDFRIYKNAQGWSTLEMQADQSISGGLRKHVKHLNNGQNSVSTHNLFRLRRHNWGVGFFEVRIYYAYYAGSYMSRWRVMGHGAGGDNYSVLQVEEKFTNGAGANWGASIQKTTGSNSSPGDNSTYYTDIQATLPNYTYAVCEMILSSGYQTDNASSGNSMGSNSYTLF